MFFRRIIFTVAIFAFSISSSAFAGSLSDVPGKPAIPNLLGYVPNKIVVKFNTDLVSGMNKGLFSSGKTGLSVLDAIGGKHGAKLIKPQFPGAQKKMLQGRVIDLSGWHEIHFTGEVDVKEVVKEYKSVPGVIEAQPVSIHPVYGEPNDQFYYLQWHLPKIQAPQAWDIETGNSSVTVAILDTGVRYFMQDLGGSGTSYYAPTQANGNMWINLVEKNGSPGVDDDGNGFVDDWIGWDFVVSTEVGELYPCSLEEDCNTPDNDPRDFNGHGTHCAGSVGAMNNNAEAVASVSGGWGNGALEMTGNGVKVMPLRIGWSADYLFLLEVGLVDMSYAAQAFYYAADNGAKIASCSWGSENTGGIKDAIDYFLASGGLIFKAAGNDGADSPDYISSLSGGLYERIIKVAASDENDCIAYFSNFGNWVTLSAPGVGIYSCYHDHYDPVTDYVAPMDGTSMAAPLAASVAALIWSQNLTQSADEVKNRLISSADSIDGLSCNSAYAGKLGAGRINVYRAVSSKKEPVDFNGDTKADILWRHAASGALAMWLMNGATISSDLGVGVVSSDWEINGVGDFNGETKADILWRHAASGALAMWLMNGATISSDLSVGVVSDLGWQIQGVGDLNGDTKADILWRHGTSGAVAMWLMTGATISSDLGVGIVSDLGWQIQEVGDFNGDTKADILWRHGTTGSVAMWLMDGATISSDLGVGVVSDLGWQIKAVGDFNGDRKSDILWRHSTTGGVAMWLMDGATISSDLGVGVVSDLNWQIKAVGDFNGDRKSDILWRHSTTGGVAMWLMNGATVSSDLGVGIVSDSNWQIMN